MTTNCPALPLYQTFPLGDASIPDAASGDSTQSKAELAEAVSMNCATGVNGRGGPTNAGGTGGKAGGEGGSAGGEGGSADDNAGAAGRK